MDGGVINTGQNAHCLTVSYDSCESLKSTVSSRGNGTTATASSSSITPYGQNHRRKRVSILKKLREKLSTTDSNTLSAYADPNVVYHQDGQPTVIRVGGTVSSCTSTVRSWRVVDDFLRNRFDFSSPSRQSTVSNRSLSSGKTYIYDDKSLEINKPDFCTVINVEDGPNVVDQTVLPPLHTNDATPTPISLENVNVIIEQYNDSNSSLSSSPSSLCVAALRVAECEPAECYTTSDAKPADQQDFAQRVAESSTSQYLRANVHSPPNQESLPTTTTTRNVPLCSIAPLPLITLPSPMINVGSFPLQPRTCASGSSPIELTNWRVRADFDGDPAGLRPSADNQRSAAGDQSSTNGFTNLNLLTPDDLPRLYPGWNVPMPPPFRFDEEFEEEPKGCCGSSRFSHSTMIRIFIAVISLIGLSCVIVGIVLGALTVSGSTRLTLCLLMIGVGVVLIIVSGIAWRLTSLDPAVSPSCWTVLGLRAQRPQSVFPERQSRTAYYRVRNVRRPITPFCGVMQSEFAWRPPPPTYQATMQEMRLQNFLFTRNRGPGPSGSPPPTYRSDNDADGRPSLNDFIQRISRPPSYRSHESIQTVSIEERPLLPVVENQQNTLENDRRRRQQNSEGLETQNGPDGSAVISTERVQSDDRAKLVAHDHLQRTNSNDNLPSTSNGGDDHTNTFERLPSGQRDTAVIDCSTAEPTVTIGIDIPQRSTRPVNVTSPQNSRHKSSRRHGYASETIPLRAPTMASGFFHGPPPPMMPRGGVVRPMPRDDFAIRHPMPFVPGRGPPHHMRPLVPIRVGPAPMRWRMPQPPNVQLMQHHRLPTIAGNIRDDHHNMANAGSFAEPIRDPSYV